jgi:hypothetical protein
VAEVTKEEATKNSIEKMIQDHAVTKSWSEEATPILIGIDAALALKKKRKDGHDECIRWQKGHHHR